MTSDARQLALDVTRDDPWEPTDQHDTAGRYGEVFTRRWVVELILDLSGYVVERDLASLVAVEPACGIGAFLGPMVDRLIASCRLHGRPIGDAVDALRAYDVSDRNVEASRALLAEVVRRAGVERSIAADLTAHWVLRRDFLLADHEPGSADFVTGNPPYIRLEHVPGRRSAAYRRACATMRGRSDVFVGFLELGLRLLKPDGTLGFIVADRWMRNQYGAALRSMISSGFSVAAVIQMHDVDAFERPVSAYPAITVVRRRKQGPAVIGETAASFGARGAKTLTAWASARSSDALQADGVRAARLSTWFEGQASWPSGTPEELARLAAAERNCPPLQDVATGTRVGIGVATGADRAFLTTDYTVAEPDRLLPVVLAKDIADGTVCWSGTCLVNPWQEGRLVALADYPRLRAYLEAHGDTLRRRHVGRRNAQGWYRTIDRIEPGLLERPKLLLPDLKAAIHPVLDDGHHYPHHNLYFVTSQAWDMEVLGGLLLSDIANMFVGAYCVKMRGGCYRFQAQYLRRIRVPPIDSIKPADQRALRRAFSARDVQAATALASRLYGLAWPVRVGTEWRCRSA